MRKFSPIAFFISEAEVKENHPLNWFNMPGYEIICSKTLASYGKSRLVAYLSTSHKLVVRNDLIKGNKDKILVVDINDKRLIAVYRPFMSYERSRKDPLNDLLAKIKSLDDESKHMIIGGDININLNIKSPELAQLNKVIDELSYHQLIQ